MIELQFTDGLYYPRLICSLCLQPVEDIKMAWVWYQYQERSDSLVITHKGSCLDQFEDTISRDEWGSMEAERIFENLIHNSSRPTAPEERT